MPEVWQMTRAAFVGDHPIAEPPSRAQANADERMLERSIREGAEGWERSELRPTGCPGFYIAEVPGEDWAILVVHDDEEDDWEVCGGYVDTDLWIATGCRGRGLSAELVLARADLANGFLEPVTYTIAGKAAHESAHRLAVQRALRQGRRVPEAVLDDYPQLAPARAPMRMESRNMEELVEIDAPGMR